MNSVTQLSQTSSQSRLRISLFAITAITPVIAVWLGYVARPDLLAPVTLIPPWFWLLPALLTMFWASSDRHYRSLRLLIGFWLCFAVGWVEEVYSLSRSTWQMISPMTPMTRSVRVVSLNCANTTRCLDDLRIVRPDIALLQEVPSSTDLQRMAKELFGENGVVLAGHDTAILANGPILPLRADDHGILISGVVSLPNRPQLHCISVRRSPPVARLDFWTSGFWTDHRDLRATHRREIGEVRDALNAIDSPMNRVIGGDFNAAPLDPTLAVLEPTVRDAFKDSGTGLGGTGTNDWPLFRVDQIWLNVTPASVFAQKTRHSDHRMVICDLLLPE